jgi:hypothetical protein
MMTKTPTSALLTRLGLGLALSLSAAVAMAAAKPCEELKAEIAAKSEAKGVKSYSLEIVAPDAVGDKREVGSCDGGSKRLVYSRG